MLHNKNDLWGINEIEEYDKLYNMGVNDDKTSKSNKVKTLIESYNKKDNNKKKKNDFNNNEYFDKLQEIQLSTIKLNVM